MEAFVQSFDQFLTVIEIWVEKKGTRTDHTCLKEKGIGMKRKQPMREKKETQLGMFYDSQHSTATSVLGREEEEALQNKRSGHCSAARRP